ncbi:MAG: hypothetical protein PF904_17275 [Kiritimatiellae bacterium]|jgi:alginate O-acetyltransferase complex protein AlgJ|nr:hypothetical protein [Kiritimatiellia bacterium]
MIEKKTNFYLSFSTTLVFIFLIATPFLGTIFRWDFYSFQAENRPLAERPDLLKTPFVQWPDKITAWFEDHFGLRNTFIRRYNGISRDWFARQPNSVIMSDKGWLFITKNGAIADFMGIKVLSQTDLKELQENIEGRQKWLKNKGVGYLWVVAPNKCMIYPEELPNNLQNARGKDGIKQFMEFLDQKNSSLNRLDMRDILLKNKDAGALYFSTDTHWTPLGSFFGYQSVINAVRRQLPTVSAPIPLSICKVTSKQWTGDLVSFVGDGKNRDIKYKDVEPPEELSAKLKIVSKTRNYNNSLDNVFELLIIQNPEGKGKAVVIHDSFGKKGWRETMPLHFKETIFIVALRPEATLFESIIETFNPDIIIEEQVQRNVIYKKQATDPIWVEAFHAQ